MIWLKAAFFCDDVRHEVGNKLSAIGIYNDAILFPPGSGPMGIPKLGTVFVIAGLKGVSDFQMRQSLSFNEKTTSLPEVNVHREDVSPDEQNVIFQQAPAVFPGEGTLTARVQIVLAGEADRTFECIVAIRRGGSPSTSPLIAGAAGSN